MILKGRLVEMNLGDGSEIPNASIEIGQKEFYQICREQFETDLRECQKKIEEYAKVIEKRDSRWNELRDEYLVSLMNAEQGLRNAISVMNEQITILEKVIWRYI